MHNKRHISLALGCKHTSRPKTFVIDKQRVFITLPFDGVRRIGDDGLERLVVPVFRMRQRVALRDVEFVEVDVVQEHVDAAEVVRREVDLLSEEAAAHLVLAEDFSELQEERAATAGGIVDLVDILLADEREPREELGDLLRRVVP